ncbi:MAG TPA: vitamin B12 dependent-methionine synthase activation domain-containing protein [Sedimentisphaerales bacterium]|nr:vitamin B12 dependent-methionine synthase activation domain-containing protein [Sedimentisphaerales bacterium]HRS09852.1 vitamin B12 dependent-methionine synthase activation domain-containing protein [Sedimentisphaerales bacterium]HRV46498.1 vitamin B12 dependent-methionine synthase activation domain-containing protein [Sedimentisphaerales bacterium]
MKKLIDIPFELDVVSIARTVHVEPDSPDGRTLRELIAKARQIARPKALYREAFIDGKGADTVTVEGVTFTSRMLRANLDRIERVFPFVATCGHEMDTVTLPAGDFLAEFWWDAIKAVLLRGAIRHLNEHLKQRFALGKMSSMSPGSGDVDVWPIEQQRELFALLGDVKGQIGVELTESFLMKPNKTVSGIHFATEVDFRSCQVCRRQGCPGRSAAFNPALWDLHQHG